MNKLTHFIGGGFVGMFISSWVFFLDMIYEDPNAYLPYFIVGGFAILFGVLATIFEERFWDKVIWLGSFWFGGGSNRQY